MKIGDVGVVGNVGHDTDLGHAWRDAGDAGPLISERHHRGLVVADPEA